MKQLIAFIALCLFLVLCWYAWPYNNRILRPVGMLPLTFQQAQADILHDIYGLTAEDDMAPIKIFQNRK